MQEENKISISERIYQLRKESGKSQGELADMLGVSRQSVSKWETGASNPEIENIIELSKPICNNSQPIKPSICDFFRTARVEDAKKYPISK